jgi:hypothetical protein
MKKINVRGGKSTKANMGRAIIAYGSLILASSVIYFLGFLVITAFGLNFHDEIREDDKLKAIMVILSMLPIVGLVIWGTLELINVMFKKFGI